MPKSTNIALAFANRAVVLFKIKQFKLAIEDINAAICTENYPQENVHKLYQRLVKSYEQIQEFENAVGSYAKLISSLKLSKLTKAQKLQIKNDTEKSLSLCKKAVTAKNLTTMSQDGVQDDTDNFPVYKSLHPQFENASGKFYILS